MDGINRSRVFVALISSAGLAPCRDFRRDHTYDNVLLEYQTALELNEMTGKQNEDFILPVHVGQIDGNALLRFNDFDNKLYADQITATSAPKSLLQKKAESSKVKVTEAMGFAAKMIQRHTDVGLSVLSKAKNKLKRAPSKHSTDATPHFLSVKGASRSDIDTPDEEGGGTAGEENTIEYDLGTYVGPKDAQGRMHGKGKFSYKNGDLYVGQFEHDVKCGQGTLTKAEGDKYTGEWVADSANGTGTFVWANGDAYVGEWLDNQKHGKGVFTWPDGEVYTGDFVSGLRVGNCVIEYADGSIYTGTVLKGLKSGKGHIVFADDGQTDIKEYEGEYAEDLEHGTGKMLYLDGCTYEGQFKAGCQHGHGKYTYKNGDTYDGQWENDAKQGQGKLIQEGVVTYDGQWENDERCG